MTGVVESVDVRTTGSDPVLLIDDYLALGILSAVAEKILGASYDSTLGMEDPRYHTIGVKKAITFWTQNLFQLLYKSLCSLCSLCGRWESLPPVE